MSRANGLNHLYPDEIKQEILDRMVDGDSVYKAIKRPSFYWADCGKGEKPKRLTGAKVETPHPMPCCSVVMEWRRQDEGWAERYAKAQTGRKASCEEKILDSMETMRGDFDKGELDKLGPQMYKVYTDGMRHYIDSCSPPVNKIEVDMTAKVKTWDDRLSIESPAAIINEIDKKSSDKK